VSDTSPVSLVCCDVVGAAAVDGSVLERAFVEAIATQGVVTGTAAYVTASESGVLCAHRAGARLVIGVLSDVHDGRRLRRAGATHLLADLGELPDLLACPA
jgi:phosphoglycolate phosphatase-like HAD superfamily hydrolase